MNIPSRSSRSQEFPNGSGLLSTTPGGSLLEPKDQKALLWALLASYLPDDTSSLQKDFVRHVEYTLSQTRGGLTEFGSFQALAFCVRDRLIERWKDTQLYFQQKDVKQVNYLSLEFLIGRSLQNALINLGLEGKYSQALMHLGVQLEELYEQEHDAGLGNGGLGRLAACFLDSLASMDYPAWGYGLRYTYGMFFQKIINGAQIELPDYWLNFGNPWEIERLDVRYYIQFYGTLKEVDPIKKKMSWEGGEKVIAVAYDYPIPGYDTYNTLNIRLWSSKPATEFDLDSFNKGDYLKAIEDKQKCENITNVLYPNDNTMVGKELRLKQQYLFVSATLQDILHRYKQREVKVRDFNWADFPSKMAVQLNDTHPTLGIPELMRLLVDQENLEWDEAWKVTTSTFAYTNHTVLPEALERWSVDLMTRLLPRHMRIIFDINKIFLDEVEKKWPGDISKLRALSIIDESGGRTVRMAHLAIVGSHTVNGVAFLHSELLKTDVFAYFYAMMPQKFQNKTNGVTPRRWLHQCNPMLSKLISSALKTERWLVNLSTLESLRALANNPDLQRKWMNVKLENKKRMAKWIEATVGIKISTDALFDVHVKRFHEYKRQLLNILSVIHRYKRIKTSSDPSKILPRVVFFGGKAAPGYFMAKLIIKLINSVANVVNNDKDVGDILKVVFIPNYCVSAAEIIIPSSDISQHISTAGTEASGTSNMKFSMNGGLILGTLDGANIEIREEIGEDNMFIFGAKVQQINDIHEFRKKGGLKQDPRFTAVLEMITLGTFGTPEEFKPIINAMKMESDHYLLGYDFTSYLEAQDAIDVAYTDTSRWARMSILATAGSGKFSSDRTIKEYAEDIWDIQPARRPGPVPVAVDRLASQGLSIPHSGISPAGSPAVPISLERLSPPGQHSSLHNVVASSRSPTNTVYSSGFQRSEGFNPS